MEAEQKIYEKLCDVPLMDIHTHIDALHISARNIADIMLYHMVISELYSAGCLDGMRLSEEPHDSEISYRIERALPYYQYIENTSCYWAMQLILKNLYSWNKPVTKDNWRELDSIIREKASNNWGKTILQKAKIKRVCTELWRGHQQKTSDVFQYSLEWAFFSRCQWGQFDTALLELENAWNQEKPGAPLPVNLERSQLNFSKTIKTIDDVDAAIKHYCERIPYHEIISIAAHFSTDITYKDVTRDEMIKALSNREKAGVWERDVYANYITNIYFEELERKKTKVILQFSIGAEPLPFETGSKLKTDTIFELAKLFSKYKSLKFSLFLSNASQNQALCTLARELPNLSLAGYWWHNFFPQTIRKIMTERLDMLPCNKQFGFFSDAYCADWAYAKAIIIRKQLAEVLSKKIKQEQYSEEQAVEIACKILYKTAVEELGMSEHERSKNY